MPYDDLCLWPNQIDVFPSLENNASPTVKDNQVVFAEHYRKVRNCIIAIQSKWTGTAPASGDGTLVGLSHVIQIKVPIDAVMNSSARYTQYFNTQVYPGNVLPFEFMITYNGTDYITFLWTGDSASNDRWDLFYKDTTETALEKRLGGIDFRTGFPMVSATVMDDLSFAPLYPAQHVPTETLIVNSYGVVGKDALFIRGCLIDTNSAPGGTIERWETYPNVYLYVTVEGVVPSG